MRRLAGADGQAAVEVVALVPILVAVAFSVYAVLMAGRAATAADSAAHAAAVAALQGRDAAAQARAAAGRRRGVRVKAARGAIVVRVAPPLPAPLDRILAGEARVVLP